MKHNETFVSHLLLNIEAHKQWFQGLSISLAQKQDFSDMKTSHKAQCQQKHDTASPSQKWWNTKKRLQGEIVSKSLEMTVFVITVVF